MDARRKQVLGVLAVAVLILTWRICVIIADYFPAAQARADTGVATPAPPPIVRPARRTADDDQLWVLQRQLQARPWGRDPFMTPPGRGPDRAADRNADQVPVVRPDPGAIRFTGAARLDGTWRAIVSGQIVGLGEEIRPGFRVVGITKRTMTLASGNWRFRYELGSAAATPFQGSEKP